MREIKFNITDQELPEDESGSSSGSSYSSDFSEGEEEEEDLNERSDDPYLTPEKEEH